MSDINHNTSPLVDVVQPHPLDEQIQDLGQYVTERQNFGFIHAAGAFVSGLAAAGEIANPRFGTAVIILDAGLFALNAGYSYIRFGEAREARMTRAALRAQRAIDRSKLPE